MTTGLNMNIRPKNQPDAMPYNPQRDLANIYLPAMREAVVGLDRVNWEEYFSGWAEAVGITDEHLGEGVRLLAEAHRLFVGDPTIKNARDALRRVGFFDLPTPVRILIFERFGEVITGGFFVAIRDVTRMGDVPPQLNDIADFVAVTRSIAREYGSYRENLVDRSTEGYGYLTDIDRLNIVNSEQSRALDNLRRVSAQLAGNLQDARYVIREARLDLGRLSKRSLWRVLCDWWKKRDYELLLPKRDGDAGATKPAADPT